MFISVFRNPFLHGGTPETIFNFSRNRAYENVYRSEKGYGGYPLYRHRWDGFVQIRNGHKHNTNKDNLKCELTEKKLGRSWQRVEISPVLSITG
jgi:hypothetical protein